MNKYWDLSTLKQHSKEVEEIIKNTVNGGRKTVLNLNNHSCFNREYVKFEVGSKYWINQSILLLDSDSYKLCEITYIRSGIIFYKVIGESEEKYLAEFSIAHLYASPEEISVPLDENYYEVIDMSGKIKVNYTSKAI